MRHLEDWSRPGFRASSAGRWFLFAVTIAALMCALIISCTTRETSTSTENRPPSINGIVLEPPRAAPGDTLTATAVAGDPEGGPIHFLWKATEGTLLDSLAVSVQWIAPDLASACSLTVYVNDEVSEVSMTRVVPVGAGHLVVESFPEGATAIIDSEPTQFTTPLTIADAPAGGYLINVERAPYNYSPNSRSVDVVHGETTHVRFKLNEAVMALTPMTVSDCVSQSSWSPDGSRVICAVENSSLNTYYLAILDSPWPDAFGDVIDTHGQPDWAPCWCPTQCEFLFASSRFARTSMIFKVDIDLFGHPYEGTPELILMTEANYPVWSPDGSTIAFVAAEGGSFSLNVVPGTGGSPTVLVSDVVQDRPSWSSDGSQIVFSKMVAGEPCLFSVPSTGGAPQQLCDIPGTHPSWSPNDSKIAFVSSFDGTENVWILFLQAGPEPVAGQLTSTGADWPAWRPDGHALCYTMFSVSEGCHTLWLAENFPF